MNMKKYTKKEYRVQTNYPRSTLDRVELFIDGVSKGAVVIPSACTAQYIFGLRHKAYLPVEESVALQYLERQMENQI